MSTDERWDRLLGIRTTGRDDSRSDTYHYPYEPTPYSVLERLASSGLIRKGMQVRMMATGATAEVVEVGYFGPGQFIPCDELAAGQVGYFTASIKNIKDARVGDTVTEHQRPCAEPLPGYKRAQPMVYCGLYPKSCSSTTLLCFLNRRLLWLWALDSDADSWAFCIWK